MHCWKCGTQLEDPPDGKITFRMECDKCLAAQHCCQNCRYYRPGLPNDCEVPGTDYIRDRQAINFCEEFKVKLPSSTPQNSDNGKNRFNNLFKD